MFPSISNEYYCCVTTDNVSQISGSKMKHLFTVDNQSYSVCLFTPLLLRKKYPLLLKCQAGAYLCGYKGIYTPKLSCIISQRNIFLADIIGCDRLKLYLKIHTAKKWNPGYATVSSIFADSLLLTVLPAQPVFRHSISWIVIKWRLHASKANKAWVGTRIYRRYLITFLIFLRSFWFRSRHETDTQPTDLRQMTECKA